MTDVLSAAEFSSKTARYWLLTTGAGVALVLGAGLGIIVGAIVVAQTLYAATVERLGEFATIRAMGASNSYLNTIVFKQGFPWNAAAKYHRASPTYKLDKVRTPTLIHVGANDERCPPGHSRMLYRALKEYGHVPTELIVYPGEPHGLTKYRHRRAKMEWDLAWLNRHVLGKK